MKLIDDVYEIDHNETRFIITTKFSYNPKENPEVLTSIRKYFIETLPKEAKKTLKYNREIIYPLNYSYLRSPVSIELLKTKRKLLLANRAVGMTVIYSFLGLQRDFRRTTIAIKKLINLMLKRPYKYVKVIEDVKISVGFEI